MFNGLAKYSLFSGMLAFAGLPIYLHAPKYFVDTYDISLTAIGFTLLGLRLLDFIQDPIIGWWLDNMKTGHELFAAVMGVMMSGSMFALFAVPAIGSPLIWFITFMIVLFSSFSILSILFYSQGIEKAKSLGGQGHVRLAIWREAGGLVGVCFAALIPTIFAILGVINPMAGFAISFVLIALISTYFMAREWKTVSLPKSNLRLILIDPTLRYLLFLALLNAAPLAITTTLFLFYVEACLGSQTATGPLLLIFFLCAALSTPIWGKLVTLYSTRKTLLFAMVLSIISFSFVFSLGAGDIFLFAIVCAVSGFTLGADMTLLPAAFARRIDQMGISGGQAFGAWSFCAKFTLALAAAFVLPLLDWVGFSTNEPNTDAAIWALTLLYAGLPCILKLGAMLVLSSSHLREI